MRFAVKRQSDWRGDVHDTFDQLSLLAFGHGLVSPLKLVACQTVARFEFGDDSGVLRYYGTRDDALVAIVELASKKVASSIETVFKTCVA